MGALQIVSGGIITNGEVHVMDTLIAAKIISRNRNPIRILASHNLSLAATNDQGKATNTMLLSEYVKFIYRVKWRLENLSELTLY